MGDIYEFENQNFIANIFTEQDIQIQERFLQDSFWYHGLATRTEAESRIINSGEFLVRLSQETDCKFVVTTKWNGKFIHISIKTDVDPSKKQLVYFINDKFKFPTVFDLIMFHKDNQFPLSDSSEAVLYRPVDINNSKNNSVIGSHRESKFRKSTHAFKRQTEKRNIPRSGSETYLTNSRYSGNDFPELNKSLTNLNRPWDVDAPNKPKKPSSKLLNSKHLLMKLRPSNILIRNKKLYKESGDYSDYNQVRDSEGALVRERARRGMSVGNRSPSLFGLNSTFQSKKKLSVDESIYISPNIHDNVTKNSSRSSRHSTSTLTAETPVMRKEAEQFDVYGFDKIDITSTEEPVPLVTCRLGLVSFINLALNSHFVSYCGPIESVFDKTAINRSSQYLLTNANNHITFCRHLIDELGRIFTVSNRPLRDWKIGYRWIFLPCSDGFQRDISIRQTALTHFIMATIVSTVSTETRINLIFFWIKCADYLLKHVQDIFHFMAVFSAIFSDQILNLRVWKLVYRQDPSAKHLMESFKEAIKNGCLYRTDIDKCIPDIVQLGNIFSGNDDDLDRISRISFDIAMWYDQEFTNPNCWLKKISKELNTNQINPCFREIVQTETLLCLILGRSSISHDDITPLFEKISDCIRMMAKLCNEG